MPTPKMTPMREAVLERVMRIPQRRVVRCKDISGRRCSRVPGAMHYLVTHGYPDLPWYRVVRSNGALLENAKREQEAKLRGEEVHFLPNGRVDDEFFLDEENLPFTPYE